jgi:hypothetical protein
VTTIAGAANFALDRWRSSVSQSSKFSMQQNAGAVTPPAGFTNYLGCTSLSAYTVGASDNFDIRQNIEGFNVTDLSWGTASASPVTLSFWVRSSLTGAFGGGLKNSASNRSYPFSYTINSANTWEQKTITIAGDTTGTWLTDNGTGVTLTFGLGVGSTLSGTAGAWAAGNFLSATGATSVVGTSGATFYITGVQLEKGSNATSFDYRPYGTELALCQRYFSSVNPNIATDGLTNTIFIPIYNPVSFRTTPTITIPYTDASYTASGSPSSTQWNAQTIYIAGASKTGTISLTAIALPSSNLYGIATTGATFNIATNWIAAGSSIANITASAEL